uniref:TrkA monooxygenase/FAD dependent oxidoreductase n=1 Tax=Adineta vaga TaxID=104782 RepID=B3G4H7_ADIVA|nr:TrkA monooxygenase/FAD dependent oxidoreductase [Adineta vaga]
MTTKIDSQNTDDANGNIISTVDVVIVGAGFAGLYMLHQVRERGYSAKVFEVGGGVGGTWYWNRYPGARSDVESMQYSYSFNEELQQEWQWSERYASQSEILRYLNYVTDKLDLWKDIQLDTRVMSAIFDESSTKWTIRTNRGDQISAKFCVMATGCLSIPKTPDIKGLDRFKGKCYSVSQWPHENINFSGHRVAVIGTGSSAIQCIPVVAEEAAHLYVFQRTANYSIPLNNEPMKSEYEEEWKTNYVQRRREMRQMRCGVWNNIKACSALSLASEELQQIYETAWQQGGIIFLFHFNDLLKNEEANKTASEFVCTKIREIVKDPTVAKTLLPQNYFLGTKRVCCDTTYYETYNRENVTLVDIYNDPIDEIIPLGIKTKDKTYEVDDIILAIGFDAITGALLNIDILGSESKTLREKWANEPRTYLGIMVADFPNLFIITGPGSPSEISNMATSIEEHVKWITECLEYIRTHNFDSIEPTSEAENSWFKHVNDVANTTLYPTGNSWYTGANIAGKPRIFMPYVGGCPEYWKKCEEVKSNGYEGFSFKKKSAKKS